MKSKLISDPNISLKTNPMVDGSFSKDISLFGKGNIDPKKTKTLHKINDKINKDLQTMQTLDEISAMAENSLRYAFPKPQTHIPIIIEPMTLN